MTGECGRLVLYQSKIESWTHLCNDSRCSFFQTDRIWRKSAATPRSESPYELRLFGDESVPYTMPSYPQPSDAQGTELRALRLIFSSAQGFLLRHMERLAWGGALLMLAVLPPEPGDWSFCPLSWFSLPCPGCGLGNAISLALQFRLQESIQTHWLGLPVLAWMVLRVFQSPTSGTLRSAPTIFNTSAP